VKWTPRPYHPQMVDFILDCLRCLLFVPMGFGKSSAVLAALDALFFAGLAKRVLVVAPLRVARSTWPAEIAKWSNFNHLTASVCCGDLAERLAALASGSQILTINYDQLEWLVEQFKNKPWPFDIVVLDEVTRVKNARTRQGTKRAGALLKVCNTSAVKRVIGLTGTPSPNGLQDLYGMLLFIDQGFRLGRSYSAFENRWFGFQRAGDAAKAHTQFVKRVAFPHAADEIQNAISDVCLTLAVKDWFDVADPIVNNVYVDLPPKARKLYRQMEKELFIEIDGHEIEAFGAAAKTIKCLQGANGAYYLDGASDAWAVLHDEKLEALRSIVEELNGAPLLVAYNFKSDLARILKAFPQARHLDAKSSTIDEWNAGKIPMLIAHPQSASHGLNLAVGGNTLAFFGVDWNLEYRLQIVERIGPVRQQQAGLDRPVYIHNIIARDTVDELVLERLESKRSVQEILLEALKRRKG